MTSRRVVQYAHDQPCTHQLLFRLVFFLIKSSHKHGSSHSISQPVCRRAVRLFPQFLFCSGATFSYYFFIFSHLVSGPISSWRCSNFPSQYFNVLLGSPWHQRGERRPQQLPSGMCLSANDAPSTESERLPLRWPPDRLEPS